MNKYTVNTYNPSDVVLSFGGYNLVGWESISITRDSSQSIMVRGIRGKNTRVLSKNTSAVIEVVCNQTSAAHDVFSQIVVQDAQTKGNGRIELMLKDLNGGMVFSSTESYVVDVPTVSYGASMGTFSWQIQCLKSEFSGLTSKTPQTSLLDSLVNSFQ